MSTPHISVVIALFNEVESLPELHRQLTETLGQLGRPYELLFIDDGSRDGSLELLNNLSGADEHVRVISLRRNQGKSAALAVGFEAASGDFVITMDADLQDNPAEIPALLAKLDEGYDLVSGWKRKRYDPISKTVPSKFFNMVTSWVSGIRLHDFNCGLKAYRQAVVKDLFVYGELHRFLPVLAHKMGYRCTEIPVVHRARQFGKSKFGMSRFLNGFLDLLTVVFLSGYNRAPLHFFGSLGLVFGLIGLGINGYLTIQKFMGQAIGNRPLLFLGVLLMVIGVQFFSFGLIGEMLTHSTERQRTYPVKFDSAEAKRDAG
ncbi:MAG: glycosyltransferase family 2 protein [Calditrichaeota bacterium]|nr:glycosyltransferase family 2 protein [Calditrichota bacterium]MCB9366380.1 glycosyltransferase family 2 protein [Calditrichota bacterium]MCB9391990.1 glycosyltransferase family 2 protein [Calditrichota bacterium]